MPRFHFNTANGESRLDPGGVELPDLHTARKMGMAYMGEMLREDHGTLWDCGSLSLTITDDDGLALYRLDVAMTTSPAAIRG